MFQELLAHINAGGGTVDPNNPMLDENGEPRPPPNVELHGIPAFAFDLTQIDMPFSRDTYGRCNYYF